MCEVAAPAAAAAEALFSDDGGEGVPAWAPAANPALAHPSTTEADHPNFGAAPADVAPLSPAAVAAARRREHRFVAVRYADGKNRGQGAAMSLALAHARAGLVAQMEADDARPNGRALGRLVDRLRAEPDWDGACSEAVCFGATVTQGMAKYVAWQNSLRSPEDLAEGRFIEIPALHQTALFRRAAVDATLRPSLGVYRDGPAPPAAAAKKTTTTTTTTTSGGGSQQQQEGAAAPEDDLLDTPVDLWWWLSFFDRGLRCGRVVAESSDFEAGPALDPPGPLHPTEAPLALQSRDFCWRQHARQRTRQHGRLSLDNLRLVKLAFLLRAIPAPDADILVVSVGRTLQAWARDLEAHPRKPKGVVRACEWRPSKRPAARQSDTAVPPEILRAHAREGEREDAEAGGRPPTPLVRLFAYGEPRARARVRLQIPDWDKTLDFFVA